MRNFFNRLFHKHDKFYGETELIDYCQYTRVRWYCMDCGHLGSSTLGGVWITNPFGKIKRVELTPEEWARGMWPWEKYWELKGK